MASKTKSKHALRTFCDLKVYEEEEDGEMYEANYAYIVIKVDGGEKRYRLGIIVFDYIGSRNNQLWIWDMFDNEELVNDMTNGDSMSIRIETKECGEYLFEISLDGFDKLYKKILRDHYGKRW